MELFVIVALAIYFSYSGTMKVVSSSSLNLSTLSIIQNEIESARNMAYDDIGTVGGVPPGRLLPTKTVYVGDTPYTVTTTVRDIDDPFDGTANGTPRDLAPADYKLIEITVACGGTCQAAPATMTTTVAPQNLESATKNGSLFINVFDASGHPISGANIHISNTLVTPTISLDDTTNVNGVLQLVDTATSSFGYNVAVSDPGYTSDQTLKPGLSGNPNPTKPYATVAKQQVTSLSFAIDHYSTLNVNTAGIFCQPIGNIHFLQTGTRLIGTNPNVLEYSAALVTDASGHYTNNALKWDTFNFQNQDTSYEVSGMFTLTPLVVNPSATYNFNWLMEAKNPLAALVTVLNSSGSPINDAKVTLTKSGVSTVNYSGQRFAKFTDWSSGQYTDKSANMSVSAPTGSLTLAQVNGKYATSSLDWLTSQTVDLGTANTAFYALNWSPTSQPASTTMKIQIATNNDNTTWNYLGPDGTANTYYTASGTTINSIHNGNRYLRYKVYMTTLDKSNTPRLDDLTIYFHSDCIPDGQTYFSGLTSGTYSIKIEKTGYTTLNVSSFSVTGNWQEYRATMSP